MSQVPDAWDDDYEHVADTKPTTTTQPRLSRAERKAQHEQANAQLWNSAENPEPFHFVESRNGGVPLQAEPKPGLKILSRKPGKPSKPVATVEDGMRMLQVEEDDIDSEEEERRERERTLKERQEKAALERAEKQRKYAEARERIMGSPMSTADMPTGRNSPTQRSGGRQRGSRGRGRGALGGRESQQTSSAEHSPARKQLYDPYDKVVGNAGSTQRPTFTPTPTANKPVREPRGPDGSGRGGFGFAPRGGSNG